MRVLNLKEQREIVAVITYLMEIQTKNVTVDEVMEKFGLTFEEYRMCSTLAVPALAQGNMAGRYSAMRKMLRSMRAGITAARNSVSEMEGPAADAVRRLYDVFVDKSVNVVYGRNEDDDGEGGSGKDGEA